MFVVKRDSTNNLHREKRNGGWGVEIEPYLGLVFQFALILESQGAGKDSGSVLETLPNYVSI